MQWDEGLPLGNGFIGSIVYGGSPLKITVDRTDLWDLRPNETTLESGFNFENLKRLAKSGKAEDWKEFFPGGGRYFVYVGYRYRDGKRLRRRGKNRGCVYGLHIAYRRYPGVSRLFVRLSHPEIFVGKNEKCFGHRQSGRVKIVRLSACGNQSRRRVRVVRTENAYGILLRNRNLPQRERNLLHACFFERR